MKFNSLTDSKILAGLLAIFLLSSCASMRDSGSAKESLLQTEAVEIKPLVRKPDLFGKDAYHLLVAELAISRGQTQLAVEHYLQLAKSQQNPAIAERAVRVAVYGEDLAAAVEAAQRWVELDPERTEAQQVIAAIYIRQDRVDDAFAYLVGVIEKSEISDKQLFGSLIGVLAREKNTSTVMAVSRKIADKYPKRPYALYLHAMLSAQGNKPDEALRYIDRALDLEEIEGAHNARAKLLLQLGRREEAVFSLERAVKSFPNDKNLRMTYARLLVDMKQYEKARVEFERLYAESPEDDELLYTLGLLSLESQRLDDAEKYLLKLIETGKREGEALYYLGRINEGRQQYDDAIGWYQRVHDGQYQFDARLRIADMLGKSGRFEEANDYLKSMLKGSQSHASLVRIYMAQGDLMRSVERYDEAIEVYNTALEVVPGNNDLLYARALTAENIDRLDILEADLRAILKTEPDNAHALNALGFTLADRTERYEEAYELIKRALDIMPEDPAIIDSFGWVNYRLGNYDEAIRLLRRALSRYEDAEIAAHLGEVLWVSGKKEEARTVWQKALKKSPGDPLIEDVMRRLIQ
ncbi:MAG: tetratricopeptide repeat protein [Gammaproteobacteria bacterium]|nr:tetratricopeptide repeat protein [Gammaproteobacteria bacterium]